MSVAPTLFLIEPWTFGNNAQTDVCLQDLARGDGNITTSFCLLLASSWSYQSQVSLEERITGAFPNALQCKVSRLPKPL